MATEIKKLNPQAVWSYFYDLTQIPRPTGQTTEVCNYLLELAKKLGLEAKQDECGNVLMKKPASPGKENAKVVTLQSHVDMVPQKNKTKEHDFSKDPINALIDGEWVRADETTLGADNGIGVAYALAIMADKTLEHGPLEALFTIDEEVGMVGAFNLKPGFCKGDILLNLDSEEEGNLYIGCAGGIDITATLSYKDEEAVPQGYKAFSLELGGLKGGHSGVDIHLGRGNANKMMTRFLKKAIEEHQIRLSHLEGGGLRNAIPRDCSALVCVPEDNVEGFKQAVKDCEQLYNKEYKGIENPIHLQLEPAETPATIVPEEIQDQFINAVEAVQNGVITMLHDFPDTVESSSNLAYIKLGEGELEAKFLTRSSSDSRKQMVASSIESAFAMMGAKVAFSGDYTGWQPNADSYVMDVMSKTYEEVFGEKPSVMVMHAGLECGIIQGAMPDMDMISFGPEIRHPHSPDEKVNIQTVEKTYKYLVEALKRL